MGTRGLLGHIVRSKNIKKGCYGDHDSYPSALGCQLVKFIKSVTDEQIQKMAEMIAKIEWIEDDGEPAPKEVQDRYTAFGFADLGVSQQRSEDWYCLLRNVQGAAALPHILDGTLSHLVNSTNFAEDRIFCEWTYFVDWEARVLHVNGYGIEEAVGFTDLSAQWMCDFDKTVSKERA